MRKHVYILISIWIIGTSVSAYVTSCKLTGKHDVIGYGRPLERSKALEMYSRRQMLLQGIAATLLITTPSIAKADVSDGNALPRGMQEFNRCIRLRRDLKKVIKRVSENAAEIDKQEWDNISKFLRTVYSTGDDMALLSKSISNPNNKQRALNDIDQLRKFSQAGDIPVSKQDADGFLLVAGKMVDVINDWFDALIDAPPDL